jgi:hypothetical protein
VPFSDVHLGDYFYLSVENLACDGVVSGYGDGSFRPYNSTTRSQLAKIVALAEGWPLANPGNPTFSDVAFGSTFYSYVETAVQHGVISGYACGNPEPCDAQRRPVFRPSANVTRGQVAKIIVLAQAWATINPGTPTFTDVAPGTPFYVYVETANSHGVISGYADHTFRPGNGATRGQICKIVYSATNP